MTRTYKPLPGRRAIVLGRLSAVMHAFEAPGFGIGLAAGLFLTARKAGELLLLDRRGSASDAAARPGLWLLAGIALVTASLLFFHRKARLLRHRLIAAGVAIAFFAVGYARELHAARTGTFFGIATFAPEDSFVEDDPARPSVRYAINRWGLRGAPFEERAPDGTARVAVVGDSLVFGAGVEEDGTLARHLDARLRERFPAARLEVLNLGLPEDNLLSHLAMARVAEERLGASVIVLCLSLPDDLAAWDGAEARAASDRVSGFSFATFLFGRGTALAIWSDRNLPRTVTLDGVAFFDRAMSRLAAARAPTSKPILLFTTSGALDVRLAAALKSVPGLVVVPSVASDDVAPAGDGASVERGNASFSRQIAAAIDPAWIR